MIEVLQLMKEDPRKGLNVLTWFVNLLIHNIPDRWKDQQFDKELSEAKVRMIYDIRPTISGYPLSFNYCEKRKIPVYQEVTYDDPWKQNSAIINLFERRGILSRPRFKEIMTGKKFDPTQETEIEVSEEDILGDIFEA